MKPDKLKTTNENRQSDLRLRILSYHVELIADLKPGEMGCNLHTVQGFDCHVERLADGDYIVAGVNVGEKLRCAIKRYFELLTPSVTGLHFDND